MPSRWSSVPNSDWNMWRSVRTPVDRPLSKASFTHSLIIIRLGPRAR
jgi:hypothetical protein